MNTYKIKFYDESRSKVSTILVYARSFEEAIIIFNDSEMGNNYIKGVKSV